VATVRQAGVERPERAPVTRSEFCVIGSDMSPPAGDTAPTMVTEPIRSSSSLPSGFTRPLRS